MRFLDAARWELVHWVPATVLLVAAVWYWGQGKRTPSVVCALGGAVAGQLLLRFGAAVTGAARERLGVMVVNTASMSLLHLLLAAYLGSEADWSNWKVDLGLGGLAGLALPITERVVAHGAGLAVALWPSIGVAAGAALALLVIRELKRRTLALALTSATLLAALMTVLVSAIGLGGWAQG